MNRLQLKEDVTFENLKHFGFEEDPANVGPGDTYYGTNNYYVQQGNFRIVVSMHGGGIEIVCMAQGLEQMHDLSVLYDLIIEGLVEVVRD